MQAKVRDVEAQLTQVNAQLAQLRHQQQELELQNQVLENTTQTHSSLSPAAEDVLLWKVTLLLHLHSNLRHTSSSFVLPHLGGCSVA
jgi:prefoldin subunit 5